MDQDNSKLAADLQRSLIDIAVEGWRFAKVFGRVLDKMDAGEGARYINQHRYYVKRLEESLEQVGLRFVNVEGSTYDPGMAATAINIADFGPADRLLVDQVVEPIIMGPEDLIRVGTIMLRKTTL